VKLVIASNWGHKDYTEVMDLEINGTPIGTAPPVKSFSGVFDSNYGPIRFAQNGNSVSACYYDGSGTLHGATEGRTLRFDWYQTGNNHGTAMMVLNGDGTLLNGVWYKNGVPQGPWLGHRTDGACNCEVSVSGNGIARRLVDSQRAILYGIHFDTDSATIKPESAATLNELLSVLGDKAGLRIEVEGHTDSTNTAAYNQSLSQRRAQAVVDWLKQHSIAAARITAKGYGADKPVADNTTMQGRALNRRVEISALK
jgi:outer membrane protein OmpA-like peptidoglycan-associated protein